MELHMNGKAALVPEGAPASAEGYVLSRQSTILPGSITSDGASQFPSPPVHGGRGQGEGGARSRIAL